MISPYTSFIAYDRTVATAKSRSVPLVPPNASHAATIIQA
jgi:hypothetical protein